MYLHQYELVIYLYSILQLEAEIRHYNNIRFIRVVSTYQTTEVLIHFHDILESAWVTFA